MANMSYCRFENTYGDLQECYDNLIEAGSIKEVEKNQISMRKNTFENWLNYAKILSMILEMKKMKKMKMDFKIVIIKNPQGCDCNA